MIGLDVGTFGTDNAPRHHIVAKDCSLEEGKASDLGSALLNFILGSCRARHEG